MEQLGKQQMNQFQIHALFMSQQINWDHIIQHNCNTLNNLNKIFSEVKINCELVYNVSLWSITTVNRFFYIFIGEIITNSKYLYGIMIGEELWVQKISKSTQATLINVINCVLKKNFFFSIFHINNLLLLLIVTLSIIEFKKMFTY